MPQRRLYQTAFPYFVTTVVRDREPAFRDVVLAHALAETILGACALKSFDVAAWAILPDHVQLLVEKTRSSFIESCTFGYQPRTHNGVRCGVSNDFSPEHAPLCACDAFDVHDTHSYPRMMRSDARQTFGLDARATITDLMRTIKGTFAYEQTLVHFWQKRFY